jgi:hypothetical protein
MRMLAAGRFNADVKVIGGFSWTFGNVRDINKIEGEKFVITNQYHVPRVLLIDPKLKVIAAESILGIPFRVSQIEIIKFYLTKIWLKLFRR